MAFTLDSHLLVGLAGLLLGLLIALLFGGGRAKRRYEVYEAKIGQHRAETEARDAERASLEREVASLRDQVRPLSDEVDRLRRQLESRRTPGAVIPPPASASTIRAESDPVTIRSAPTVDTAGPAIAGGAIAPSFTPAEATSAAPAMSAAPVDQGPLPAFLDAPRGQADDLRLLKGVGDRFAAKLNDIGVFHFRQIANWSPEEEAAADARLDAFRGRVGRDRLVEQATLLAAGRRTEYEARFGKLGAPDGQGA
jgi:predicted flap endonuclease-1-like 5' DNA nuclease